MKKTVIIILALLPIYLIFTVSFAIKIIKPFQNFNVEKIEFTYENGETLPEEYVLRVQIGEELDTYLKIIPEIATDKTITYTSTDENVCTINEFGKVKGLNFGTSIIVAKSASGKTTTLIVRVTQDNVTGVSLPYETLELTIGDTAKLQATIDPYVALNKNVTYYSSDPTIATIDANGNVKALKTGSVTITAITEDGGYSDTCIVTCTEGTPALKFNFDENENFEVKSSLYMAKISEINLIEYLQIDEKRVIINDVRFRIKSGGKYASLNNSNLTLTSGEGMVTIVAYVGEVDNPTYQTQVRLKLITE